MNISTLTTVMLSALLVTSGLAFAAPGGTADANAGASGNVSAGGVQPDSAEPNATNPDQDGTSAGDGGSDHADDEGDGAVSRLGVTVSAVVGGDTRADGGEFETRGDASVERSERSDADGDVREPASERVRSIHDLLRAFLSGSLDGGLGVHVGVVAAR